MVKLELTLDQAGVLKDVLEKVLRDLSYEIADTDTKNFRDQLKARRDALAAVVEALPS